METHACFPLDFAPRAFSLSGLALSLLTVMNDSCDYTRCCVECGGGLGDLQHGNILNVVHEMNRQQHSIVKDSVGPIKAQVASCA